MSEAFVVGFNIRRVTQDGVGREDGLKVGYVGLGEGLEGFTMEGGVVVNKTGEQ